MGRGGNRLEGPSCTISHNVFLQGLAEGEDVIQGPLSALTCHTGPSAHRTSEGCIACVKGGRGGEGSEMAMRSAKYLSGTARKVPTRSVFKDQCHCYLICAHYVFHRGGMWGIFGKP